VYALYAGGTAPSAFFGPLGILTGTVGDGLVTINGGTHPSANALAYVYFVNLAAPVSATTEFSGFKSTLNTANTAVVYTAIQHFWANTVSRGAASTITSVYGFRASNAIASGTNNFAFWSDLAAAAGTFAFYGSGTADSSFGGAILCRSATAGIGYATGAGGTVAQATSKATGVSLNKNCGQITMNAAALAAGAKVSFVVTNSACVATDIPDVVVVSGGTANAYTANVTAVAAGSFTITVQNITAGSLSEAPVIGFSINKAVTA
jgi:hypothetical protein